MPLLGPDGRPIAILPQAQEGYKDAQRAINTLATALVGRPGALAGLFCEIECMRSQNMALMQILIHQGIVTEQQINEQTVVVMRETCARLQDQLLKLNQAKEEYVRKQEEERLARETAEASIPNPELLGQDATGDPAAPSESPENNDSNP